MPLPVDGACLVFPSLKHHRFDRFRLDQAHVEKTDDVLPHCRHKHYNGCGWERMFARVMDASPQKPFGYVTNLSLWPYLLPP